MQQPRKCALAPSFNCDPLVAVWSDSKIVSLHVCGSGWGLLQQLYYETECACSKEPALIGTGSEKGSLREAQGSLSPLFKISLFSADA